MGVYRGRDMGLVTTGVSSFVKSYVSLGVALGVGIATGSEYFADGGRSLKTESMMFGGMTIGTCLGLRLLKPASGGKATASEVDVEESE